MPLVVRTVDGRRPSDRAPQCCKLVRRMMQKCSDFWRHYSGAGSRPEFLRVIRRRESTIILPTSVAPIPMATLPTTNCRARLTEVSIRVDITTSPAGRQSLTIAQPCRSSTQQPQFPQITPVLDLIVSRSLTHESTLKQILRQMNSGCRSGMHVAPEDPTAMVLEGTLALVGWPDHAMAI